MAQSDGQQTVTRRLVYIPKPKVPGQHFRFVARLSGGCVEFVQYPNIPKPVAPVGGGGGGPKGPNQFSGSQIAGVVHVICGVKAVEQQLLRLPQEQREKKLLSLKQALAMQNTLQQRQTLLDWFGSIGFHTVRDDMTTRNWWKENFNW